MISRIPQQIQAGVQYEAARPIQLFGATLKPGDQIPACVPRRRLQQLIDSRRVRPSAGKVAEPAKKGKGK